MWVSVGGWSAKHGVEQLQVGASERQRFLNLCSLGPVGTTDYSPRADGRRSASVLVLTEQFRKRRARSGAHWGALPSQPLMRPAPRV